MTLKWNVVDKETFRGRTRNVFRQVSETLVNTLGPYGSTTIIEKFGEMHITKDGWQILKKIAFDDSIEQNIMQLMVNISAQVVVKVGDGSTSSIVAANSILSQLESSDHLAALRPKELLDVLQSTVEKVTDEILQLSVKIDPEEDPEYNDIYRLAMISTNGNKDVSEMIQKIYKETQNPSIEFDKSASAKTSYEVIEGYKAVMTYLDRIYVTNEDGTCKIDNPLILMFNHKVDEDSHYKAIIAPAIMMASEQNRRLVVVAPHYDQHFLNTIATQTNLEYRATSTTAVVYARASIVSNLLAEQYNDFGVMTGGIIIRESEIGSFHSQDPAEVPNLADYIGDVKKMVIGPDTTLIQGFHKRNEEMYQLSIRDAKAKYTKLEETHRNLNVVDSQLYEVKKRLSKLTGVMGAIHVGGNSGLEKTSNYDLVEDAIKACESAYNYGYNIGGNLIIPIAIKRIMDNYAGGSDERVILELLHAAFVDVFAQVLRNKFTEAEQSVLENIAIKAIDTEQCYDLIKDEYSSEVINPSHTDIEILRAATSIVSLLLSSNQYISINLNTDQS